MKAVELLFYMKEVTRDARQGATMAKTRPSAVEQEPMGIVISRGSRAEDVPKFSAYVWGPVPEAELEASKEMVAA
jgi:hypothetical protein